MAYTTVDSLFGAIADAVREKDGTTGLISRQDLPDRIAAISTATEPAVINDASYLFAGQRNYLDMLPHIIIRNPTAMNHMFFGNDVNANIDMSLMNHTANSAAIPLNNIFYTCDAVETVKFPANLNATTLMSAFQGCTALTNIDLNGIVVSECRDFRSFLNGCKNLTEFDGSVFPDLYVVNNNCQLFFSTTTSMRKVWIPKEWHCPNTAVGYALFMSNGGSNANNTNRQIYTDAESEAAQIASGNWSQYTLCYSSNGAKVPDTQIHYGATHDEYLNA